jgi:hypothetical protein
MKVRNIDSNRRLLVMLGSGEVWIVREAKYPTKSNINLNT